MTRTSAMIKISAFVEIQPLGLRIFRSFSPASVFPSTSNLLSNIFAAMFVITVYIPYIQLEPHFVKFFFIFFQHACSIPLSGVKFSPSGRFMFLISSPLKTAGTWQSEKSKITKQSKGNIPEYEYSIHGIGDKKKSGDDKGNGQP